MKKKFLKITMIVFIAAFVFVGCTPGEDDNDGNTDGGGNQQQPIVLQWWGVFWDPGVVESLIVEYQEQNPNVKIDYANKWPGGRRDLAEDLYQREINRVLRNRESAEIPDIFMVKNTWVGEYDSYISAAPNNIIDTDTLSSAFYPAVTTDFAYDGEVNGLPLWIDVLAILYNEELLAEQNASSPPDNWVDFRSLSFDLTARTGGSVAQAGFASGASGNVSFAFEILSLLMLQNGVNMVDSSGNPVFASSAFTEDAVSFYQGFEGNNGSWDEDLDNDAVEFLEGNLAMVAAPSWRYHDILYFNDRYDLGIDIGVAPMPQVTGQQRRIDYATYWGNVVAQDRPNSQASWEFLNWLSQPEQLRQLRNNESLNRDYFGFIYPRTDMQQDLLGDTYLRVYNDMLSTAQSWPMINGLEVKQVFNELIESRGASSDISTAENRVQQIFSEQGQL